MENERKIIGVVKLDEIRKFEKENSMSIGDLGEAEYMEFIKDKPVKVWRI